VHLRIKALHAKRLHDGISQGREVLNELLPHRDGPAAECSHHTHEVLHFGGVGRQGARAERDKAREQLRVGGVGGVYGVDD
jgi:hypothetical protein